MHTSGAHAGGGHQQNKKQGGIDIWEVREFFFEILKVLGKKYSWHLIERPSNFNMKCEPHKVFDLPYKKGWAKCHRQCTDLSILFIYNLRKIILNLFS